MLVAGYLIEQPCDWPPSQWSFRTKKFANFESNSNRIEPVKSSIRFDSCGAVEIAEIWVSSVVAGAPLCQELAARVATWFSSSGGAYSHACCSPLLKRLANFKSCTTNSAYIQSRGTMNFCLYRPRLVLINSSRLMKLVFHPNCTTLSSNPYTSLTGRMGSMYVPSADESSRGSWLSIPRGIQSRSTMVWRGATRTTFYFCWCVWDPGFSLAEST